MSNNRRPNEGANRRQSVGEVIKDLVNEKIDVNAVTVSLMRSYRTLDDRAHHERDAFKNILEANVLLSKAVGELMTEVTRLRNEVARLQRR